MFFKFNKKTILFIIIIFFLSAIFIVYQALPQKKPETNKIIITNSNQTEDEHLFNSEDHFSYSYDLDFKEQEKEIPLANPTPKEYIIYNPFTFVAIGDSESYNESTGFNKELIDVLENSKKLNPNFAIFTGDMITATGKTPQIVKNKIINFKNTIENYYADYYLCIDKHDIECGEGCIDLWKQVFWAEKNPQKKLYMSFDWENTHFIILSTSYPIRYSIDDEQLKWLENDLQKTNQENIIVIQHVPPITFYKESAKDCHDMSCSEPQRSKLIALFEKYGVDLVISGHEHGFDHKIENNIDYIISGNVGNSTRYEDQTEGDIFSFIKVDGTSIDLYAIKVKKGENKIIKTVKIKE